MTLQDLTRYYSDLLAYEYRGKPNATRQIQLYAKQALADFFAVELLSAYDIELAVGNQLDTIGKYVGVERNIGPASPPPLFSLWSYNAPMVQANYQGLWDPATDTPTAVATDGFWYGARVTGSSTAPINANFVVGDILWYSFLWRPINTYSINGLTTYADQSVNATPVFYSYGIAGRQVSALPDESYRTVIKLKIVLNSIDGTLFSIIAYLKKFFPNLVFVQDMKNMHLGYLVMSTVPISVDLLKLYLPKPMGVGISVTIIYPTPGGGDPITTEDGSPITTEDGSPIITEGST